MTCEPTDTPVAEELDIPALRDRYREERERRIRPEGQEQYVASADQPAVAGDGDPYLARSATPTGERGRRRRHPRRRLVRHPGRLPPSGRGVDDFRIIDHAGDFGGVWYWNRYPGL